MQWTRGQRLSDCRLDDREPLIAAVLRKESMQAVGQIEGAGPFTLAFVMSDYVEHLKHHARQIFPDSGITSSFVNVYHA